MTLPKSLNEGDTVGIIAPASPPNINNLEKALPFLESLGLKVKLAPYVKEVQGYLAGSDQQRLLDLHQMFEDESVDAIFCAGGGYGTGRLASMIDYEFIKKYPKIFWGYSDITYLHTAIRQRTGLVTFHGPMLASDIGKEDFHSISAQSFNQLFEPTTLDYNETISPLEVISEGEATGEIVGGNLSLLVSTLGTPFEIDTKDKLLFVEDIDEAPYRIDSFLSQLKHAGKIAEAKGVIIGDFNNCIPKNDRPSWSLEDVFQDYFSSLSMPVIKGFKIGHCQPHFSIPLGTRATLSSTHKTLTVEPGVKKETKHED
ncbi:LD-carboxypeptidase [Filobacillus milosensis]|uniref:LD-carboxypeptidase n=1 Tax=Filobacillus milosensis TaxID=94137 RepID=A0A4Y8IM17_9BACI|nr:LD-carboxypeptidase [Filobacillus milosensis]TFB21075.1 LD-carboxypeptidase [Filobacillus milosensis]